MSSCKRNDAILMVILMLVGGLVMVQGPQLYPYYHNDRLYPSSPNEYSEVLTDETPTFVLIMEYSGPRIEIQHLYTNDSSVMIYAVLATGGVIANISDIKSIDSDGIAIEEQDESWNLTISKQEQDVEVTFELVFWYYPPVIDITMAVVTPYYLYGAILFLFCAYYLVKIERECYTQRGVRYWKDNRKASHVILWTLIFLLLVTPLVYGYSHRLVQPVANWQLETQEYEYTISPEVNGITIDIFDIVPQNWTYSRITLRNFQFQGTAYFRTYAEDRMILNMTVIASHELGIDFEIGNESSHYIDIMLETAQESIAFSVVTERLEATTEWDPLLVAIFAALSLIPASIALLRANEILRNLGQISNQKSSTEESVNL